MTFDIGVRLAGGGSFYSSQVSDDALVAAAFSATASPAFGIVSAAASVTATAAAVGRLWNPADATSAACVTYGNAADLSPGDVTSWGQPGVYTEATNPPVYEASGWNGLPSVLFDGTDDLLTGGADTVVANGNDHAWTIVYAFQMVVAGASKTLWSEDSTTAATTQTLRYRTTAAPVWNWNIVDDANSPSSKGLKSADTSAYVAFAESTGTAITMDYNNTADQTGVSFNVGQCTLNQSTLGAKRLAGTAGEFSNHRVHKFAKYAAQLSAAEKSILKAWAAV